MSNKVDILDALVTELEAITAVQKATRYLMSQSAIEKDSPYIGIVSGDEEKLVEDSIDIRFSLDVVLYIITEQQFEDIEGLIDDIKDAVLGSTSPIDLHTDLDVITIRDIGPVILDDLDNERYSSTQINLGLRYHASRGGF